jgi:hypothetical protein
MLIHVRKLPKLYRNPGQVDFRNRGVCSTFNKELLCTSPVAETGSGPTFWRKELFDVGPLGTARLGEGDIEIGLKHFYVFFFVEGFFQLIWFL